MFFPVELGLKTLVSSKNLLLLICKIVLRCLGLSFVYPTVYLVYFRGFNESLKGFIGQEEFLTHPL